MHRLSSTLRITAGLACLSITVLLTAKTIGLVPDRESAVMEGRAALCEAIAIQGSLMASRNDLATMKAGLEATVLRDADLIFAGVRRVDGASLMDFHEGPRSDSGEWEPAMEEGYMVVPIMAGDEPWGSVELVFRPLAPPGVWRFLGHPLTKFSLFVVTASFVIYFLYLRKLLQDLDPSKVIPDRVRTTLDTLAEGLLVLDNHERIVLANQSFAHTVGRSPDDLQGRRASDLPWSHCGDSDADKEYPWARALREGKSQCGAMLGLEAQGSHRRTFMVNSSPILGDDGDSRGALASFDDVTTLEGNRAELQRMLGLLKKSRDEVRRKNVELQSLANRDPLTSCLNRRSFYELFETYWSNAQRYRHPLSCLMVDIDHFKSINDRHGHGVGDQVLQKVAAMLHSSVREGDIVCRYGGEEFCILLPHLDLDHACGAAERLRGAIQAIQLPGLSVTASLGISATGLSATSPQELMDQADQCLYFAKRNGRNQVVRFDQVPADVQVDPSQLGKVAPLGEPEGDVAIPFHAITALISALAYRDPSTAEHCRRVADLCVAVASRMITASQAYVVENAALLHDIGKIGVPDSILLKPGPLTSEEWDVMKMHDRMGAEIIKSSFACNELTEIIENHHAWFGGNPRCPELPTGHDIPLGARILTIADAYDAMVSDRVYRLARGQEEAFAELRRCAGIQFDPELVELFIECVLDSDENRCPDGAHVSKQTALRIGLQIESLAQAVDRHDCEGLVALAQRLKATAGKSGVPHIAELAAQLEHVAGKDADPLQLVHLTTELLDLCRSTQKAYLSDPEDEESAVESGTERSPDDPLQPDLVSQTHG